jgi:hypothetical protein
LTIMSSRCPVSHPQDGPTPSVLSWGIGSVANNPNLVCVCRLVYEPDSSCACGELHRFRVASMACRYSNCSIQRSHVIQLRSCNTNDNAQ